MPPVGFEPTISASERRKTYALDRAATGTGQGQKVNPIFLFVSVLRFTGVGHFLQQPKRTIVIYLGHGLI